MSLNADVWGLVWSYCQGAPLRHVCRAWRDKNVSREIKWSMISTVKLAKWAKDQGCPWNEWTCSNAAMNGHLEVLKWARENGCPWDELTCIYATQKGYHEVLKWAREHGCPG